jgi:hypothetical protein
VDVADGLPEARGTDVGLAAGWSVAAGKGDGVAVTVLSWSFLLAPLPAQPMPAKTTAMISRQRAALRVLFPMINTLK